MNEPVCGYRCAGIVFDIYNTEDTLPTSDVKYYVTPKHMVKIEKWMIENRIDKISTEEQMNFLIQNKFFGEYKQKPLTRIPF